MNPELLRNLWLELTPRRMVMMAVVLALIFLAANSTQSTRVADVAQYAFYAIVVLWGTRDAAQSVVGEIRDRTWDFQRLSALTPLQMTVGKLLGATSYVWFGGLICLAVVFVSDLRVDPSLAWRAVVHLLGVGLLTHAIAMFASLIAVRRRQTRPRYNVFLYQAAGLAVGFWAAETWRSITVTPAAPIEWWGWELEAETFYLVSLLLFLCWALIGCYRLMRLELQVENRPTVWLAFILFMAAYTSGLGYFPFIEDMLPVEVTLSLRLVVASATLAALTYAAILFEPKDRVLYRWLIEMARTGRADLVLSRLQCWMIAYSITAIVTIVSAFHISTDVLSSTIVNAPMVLAGLGFLTRDLGIFLYFGLGPDQKRGDIPAVVTLAVLYVLLPIVFRDAATPSALLYPLPMGGWAGVAFAWIEAVAVWSFVVGVRSKQMAALPQT